MKIFITGGAGYIGTTLIPILLRQGYSVTVYDSLLFNNGDKLLPYISHPDFTFIKGDIRERDKLRESVKGYDVVIHLAALVGFPICRKFGDKEAWSVNTDGTQIVVDCLEDGQYLLFGSTGSNYGEVAGICTEDTPLNPLTAYGVTKTAAEKIVMNYPNSTAFRFATAFGVSPRLRLDLLVNDMSYRAFSEGYAVIYESHFMRTFIHVKDIARSFLFAIENKDKMKQNVYNVGSNSMNYSKKEICDKIQSHLPKTYFNFSDIDGDPDKRNYIVSYSKINSLGFDTTITLDDGIAELIKSFPLVYITSPYHNAK